MSGILTVLKLFYRNFGIFCYLLLQDSDGELEEGEHEASDESSDGELHDVCGFDAMFL